MEDLWCPKYKHDTESAWACATLTSQTDYDVCATLALYLEYLWFLHVEFKDLYNSTGRNWMGGMDKVLLRPLIWMRLSSLFRGSSSCATHEMVFLSGMSQVQPRHLNLGMLQNQSAVSLYADASQLLHIFSCVFVSQTQYVNCWWISKQSNVN